MRHRVYTVLLVGVLVGSLVGLTGFVDEASPNQQHETSTDGPAPTPIDSDGEFSDELTENDSVHRYEFDATAGEAIRFVGYIFREDPVSGRIILTDPSGDEIMNMTNRGETIDEVPYGALATETGTYTVTLLLTPGISSTEYSFALSTVEADPNGDNDDRATALSLDPGETISDHRAEQDEDWYAVSVDAGDRITATLATPDADWIAFNDLGFEIYAPNGSLVGERTPESGLVKRTPDDQTVTADVTGTYYVRVTEVDVEGYTSYDLTVDVEPPAPDVLTIKGQGEATNYQVAVSGDLQENPDDGPLEPDVDTLEGSIAEGWVTTPEHVDSFRFTGDLLAFQFLEGNATVLLNGGEVDSDSLGTDLPHVITITGTGEPAHYNFSVSGDLAPNPDEGALELQNDNLDSPRADGWVTTPKHVDSFRYSGNVSEFTFTQGNATVRVNGEEVDPADLGNTSTTTDTATSTAKPT